MRHTGNLETSKDLQDTLEVIKGYNRWFTVMDLIQDTGFTSASTKISELRANGCVFQDRTAKEMGRKGHHKFYKLISSPTGREGLTPTKSPKPFPAPSKQLGFVSNIGYSNHVEVKNREVKKDCCFSLKCIHLKNGTTGMPWCKKYKKFTWAEWSETHENNHRVLVLEICKKEDGAEPEESKDG